MNTKRQSLICRLTAKYQVTDGIVLLDFEWQGTAPCAGQFFLVKPVRSSVFLARPLSAVFSGGNNAGFLIALRGRGTAELAAMHPGEEAFLTGPLGNGWTGFLPQNPIKPVALLSGGVGIVPLAALLTEFRSCNSVKFDFFAGFRNCMDGERIISAVGTGLNEVIIVSEDENRTQNGKQGLVTGFFEARNYAAVFACGPLPMLKSVAAICRSAGTPCFVSLEARMACGTGACLGCVIQSRDGGKRCCADGPVFNAEEVFFDK
ncbi:MAG: dihydroorotate dehydrogenase electron transfer subunit [Treponema sp.]|jgi:NAD(P)H-flavin reductase|nr:dihydroorotate dehydrogenase electron transfer subunit [Treponema sp.]